MAKTTITGSVTVDVLRNGSSYGNWNYEVEVTPQTVKVTVTEYGGYPLGIGSVSITYNGQTQTKNADGGMFQSHSASFAYQAGKNSVTIHGRNTNDRYIEFDHLNTDASEWVVEFEPPNDAPDVDFNPLPPLYGGRTADISWSMSDADGDTVRTTKLVRYSKAIGASSYTATVLINSASDATSYTDTIPASVGGGLVYYEVTVTDGFGTTTKKSETKSILENEPPVISGTNMDIGTFALDPPTYTYSITDPDGGTVSVVVAVDGKEKQRFTAELGTNYSVAFADLEWLKILNGSHTIVITATDPKGATDTRILTFTKNVTSLSFTLATPLDADDMITKCIETLTASIPDGASVTIEICNNGYDASPTWENVTQKVLNREKIFLENTTKTASKWGYNVRVTVERKNAVGECWAFSMAGYFE